MKKIAIVLVLSLAGCNNTVETRQNLVKADFPERPKYQERKIGYQPTVSDKANMAVIEKRMDAYFACNKANSAKYAFEGGDVFALAITAEAMCLKQRNAFGRSMQEAMGYEAGSQELEKMRLEMTRMNVVMINKLQANIRSQHQPLPSTKSKPKTLSL
ncbi:hypothetical protein K1X45_00070 [Pseudochrobactrum sp. Wa41.01b-1]|uniref:hypothetical protein n=1 Tax=Pseudochrobactrum sp. Wa41.01b-1 TaxID=2864102 RepID=UPI001C68C1CE|nr:hypothetical protein [Pseudochrobactrum sp. Wa41.01b-1]QYM72912.1 hypothetical protein K1X45_00070 [Pseudochrobactrum sp. Wa41.01b-1]